MIRKATDEQRNAIYANPQKYIAMLPHIHAPERAKLATIKRLQGDSFDQIASGLNVSSSRANQMVLECLDKLAYREECYNLGLPIFAALSERAQNAIKYFFRDLHYEDWPATDEKIRELLYNDYLDRYREILRVPNAGKKTVRELYSAYGITEKISEKQYEEAKRIVLLYKEQTQSNL